MKTYLSVSELTLIPRTGESPNLQYYITGGYELTKDVKKAYLTVPSNKPFRALIERSLPASVLVDIVNNKEQLDYLVKSIANDPGIKTRQGRLPLDFWYKEEHSYGYSFLSIENVPDKFVDIKECDTDTIEEFIRFQIEEYIKIESPEKKVSMEFFSYGYKIEESRTIHEVVSEVTSRNECDLFSETLIVGENENTVELAVTNPMFLYGIDSNLSSDILLERVDFKVMPMLFPKMYERDSLFRGSLESGKIDVQRFRIVTGIKTEDIPKMINMVEMQDNGRNYSEYRVVSKLGVTVVVTNNLSIIKEIPNAVRKCDGYLNRTYYKITEINKITQEEHDNLTDKIFEEIKSNIKYTISGEC